MKILLIIIFLAFAAPLFAQKFEGEIDYQASNTIGKTYTSKYICKNYISSWRNTGKVSNVDYYTKDDTLIMVRPDSGKGVAMGRDAARLYYKYLAGIDSLKRLVETSRTEVISGFHCTCTEGYFASGRKREFWITTEVDRDICLAFGDDKWNEVWFLDGTTDYIKKLNLSGKTIIAWRYFDNEGLFTNESRITKIGVRPVTLDEVVVPPNIAVTIVTPNMIKESIK